MYADDLILLAISVSELQALFNLCSVIFDSLDLPINAAKSHCLRIGPRFNISCNEINLNGVPLQWSSKTRFLGITSCSAKSFTCNWEEAKNKFYTNANTIFGR